MINNKIYFFDLKLLITYKLYFNFIIFKIKSLKDLLKFVFRKKFNAYIKLILNIYYYTSNK